MLRSTCTREQPVCACIPSAAAHVRSPGPASPEPCCLFRVGPHPIHPLCAQRLKHRIGKVSSGDVMFWPSQCMFIHARVARCQCAHILADGAHQPSCKPSPCALCPSHRGSSQNTPLQPRANRGNSTSSSPACACLQCSGPAGPSWQGLPTSPCPTGP